MQKKIYKIVAAIVVLLLALWAVTNLLNNFQNIDRDGDGLPDNQEKNIGTDPTDFDSDDDLLNDKDEYDYWMNRYDQTGDEDYAPDGDYDNDGIPNILDDDSDNDGIKDGQEIENGTDPADSDSDNDGLLDGEENSQGTDPNNSDSDNDGIPDNSDPTPNGPKNPGDLTYGVYLTHVYLVEKDTHHLTQSTQITRHMFQIKVIAC